MKCPVCGDEVLNGKCSFCGYRPTEADREAREKYEKQKAGIEGRGVPGKGRPAISPERPAKAKTVPKKAPAGKPARDGRSREGPARPGGPGGPKLAPPRKPPERAGKPGTGRRPGRLKRILFKLVVIGWAVLYIGLIVQKLVQDSGNAGPPDGPRPSQSERTAGPGGTEGPAFDHQTEGGT